MPDGRHFLYYSESASPEYSGIYVGSRDGAKPRLLLRGIRNASYAPPGYLLFVKDGAILARGFDAGRVEITGDPVMIAQLPANEDEVNLSASQSGASGLPQSALGNRLANGMVRSQR